MGLGGVSLTEPHASVTALHTCMFACLIAPTIDHNFKVCAVCRVKVGLRHSYVVLGMRKAVRDMHDV